MTFITRVNPYFVVAGHKKRPVFPLEKKNIQIINNIKHDRIKISKFV